VPDLAEVANVDWALDWAFDLAAPRVAAPMIDVLLAVSRGHPRLNEALFVAALPAPGSRSGWLSESDLEEALAQPTTQADLLDALLTRSRRRLLGP
jgi:hypothetical protein